MDKIFPKNGSGIETRPSAQYAAAKDIPFSEIEKLMAPEYKALQIFLDAGDFGHTGMRRERTFIFLHHKETCEFLVSLFLVFLDGGGWIGGCGIHMGTVSFHFFEKKTNDIKWLLS